MVAWFFLQFWSLVSHFSQQMDYFEGRSLHGYTEYTHGPSCGQQAAELEGSLICDQIHLI